MRYTIKKGNHRSGIHVSPCLFKDHLNFIFKLSKECWSQRRDVDDDDISKLYGVSFGMHHKNSIRIGWEPNESFIGGVNIYAYWYNGGGKFKSLFLFVAETTVEYNVSMSFDTGNNLIYIKVDDAVKCLSYKAIPFVFPKFKHGYHLFPYIGGDHVARWNTSIDVVTK